MAVLLYGIALVTLRLRYWLPWFIGVFLAAVSGIVYSVITFAQWFQHYYGHSLHGTLIFTLYVLAFAVLGCSLGWFAYRRWLTMEIG